MTPLVSWLILAAVAACGVACAVAVARWLDARDEWAGIRQWHDMCDALEVYDWEDEDD